MSNANPDVRIRRARTPEGATRWLIEVDGHVVVRDQTKHGRPVVGAPPLPRKFLTRQAAVRWLRKHAPDVRLSRTKDLQPKT